jgi:hypothetical protein
LTALPGTRDRHAQPAVIAGCAAGLASLCAQNLRADTKGTRTPGAHGRAGRTRTQPKRDDEWLLGRVADAVRTAEDVPVISSRAGKAAFAWHTIDAELAVLTYDSAAGEAAAQDKTASPGDADQDRDAARTTRRFRRLIRSWQHPVGGRRPARTSRLTVELQPDAEGVPGQVSPPSREVQVQPASGSVTVASIDTLGCFALRPAPQMPYRLRQHTGEGENAVSGWVMPWPDVISGAPRGCAGRPFRR